MFKRILRVIKESRKEDLREKEILKLLPEMTDDREKAKLIYELENLGFFRIVVCNQCNSYRSDLEWREKKILNCRRCGSNKINEIPVLPKRVILRLLLRYLIKGY